MKKKIKKILSIFVFSLVLFSCLASTCFAYSPPPNYEGINGTGYNLQQLACGKYSGEIAWVFVEYRVPNGQGNYTFEYTYFVDSWVLSIWLEDYILENNNIPIIDDLPSLYKADIVSTGSYWSTSLLDSAIKSAFDSYQSLGGFMYNLGDAEGFERGKELSYNKGYTDGLAESDIAENTILTIFSAPTYILSTIFDFEIFGLNIYTLICFFLTLTIVSFILKRVL